MGDLEALDFNPELMEEMREAKAAGLDVPLPDLDELRESEELGGFAYEMCFLVFRERPEPHLTGEALEGFFEHHLNPKEQTLRDIFEPSREEEMAFRKAWNAFHNFERYGFPHEGGYLDQPAEWLIVHNCSKTAYERAESLNSREEAASHKRSAAQAQETTV